MRSTILPVLCAIAFGGAVAAQAGAGSKAQGGTAVRYGRDVRPILADRCFRCHGPDEKTREAHLRLDRADAAQARRHDGAAIVPGDVPASLVWQRVTTQDADERMPPGSSGKPPLSEHELAILRKWIEAGAGYEPHWSFSPPEPPSWPARADADAHPVDAFVRQRLHDEGLAPSPPADAATQARRLFLVLTGLPPTPVELRAFLADAAAGAYERLVDRLLGEEPYRTRTAEHLAVPWLDAARYADTSGIHMDAGRQVWPWRDWLVRALRDDMPFDRFVLDQLAGDLVPGATQDQRVASGFLRHHVTTDEGGAIDEEYRVEYAAERTATVGSVFLGLTLGCARCHDHKYDPVTQEDYYRLFSFFNSNREPGLYSQSKDDNRALEPFLAVPSPDQDLRLQALQRELAAAREALAGTDPAEQATQREFLAGLTRDLAATWSEPRLLAAVSREGATLQALADGSVLASGPNPARDVHELVFATEATGQRLLCLSALPHESLPHGKVGRAPNGNAVLQHVQLHGRPRGSTGPFEPIPLLWAMADVEQSNGDFSVGNALADDQRGWAVAAHQHEAAPRHAVFLTAAPFGWALGSELRVTLAYDSGYGQHALGRVQIRTGALAERMLGQLPVARGGLHVVGPFAAKAPDALYADRHGPESVAAIDPSQHWGKLGWRFLAALRADETHGDLPKGQNATYVAQSVDSPTAREVTLALGSDDGFQLFVNGTEVAGRRVDRAAAPDQDRATFPLPAGPSVLVLKVVNTGGDGGFAWRHVPRPGELEGDLALALLPPAAQDERLRERLSSAYREHRSPHHRARAAEVLRLTEAVATFEASIPRTMVMAEADTPRPTFVLERGEYDKPDPARPVARALPALFGALPADAPPNRLGLAQWMVSAQNPLLLRVAANRIWQFVFGTGLVRTSEDFGLQGEWPSHPELLDWLACEFRARGHSVRAMLRLLVTSETFRQQSRVPEAAAGRDPENRLLGWFPRRRLPAEALRDQALYVAGLLVERTGGPSVKPYQPDGLWQEVAMAQSNTRTYVRGSGEDLWRRSLYVYWKRACPPPSMLVLDAPTREFCTTRRTTTNTPLQALALWNDEQFVEAARMLAQRTLREPGDDASRLQAMHLRCTGHELDGDALGLSMASLASLRSRFAAAPADADALLHLGEAPVDASLPAAEVAALQMVASAFLNLDATLCID